MTAKDLMSAPGNVNAVTPRVPPPKTSDATADVRAVPPVVV